MLSFYIKIKFLLKQNMNKKDLSEADIKEKFITPALIKVGWDEYTQIGREIFFTDGRLYVRGKMTARGNRKFADYVLYYKPNVPIAIIEAKDNNHTPKAGMQQALGYANILDIPFVFSSNGDSFYFHDKTATNGQLETKLSLDEFPSPAQLWEKYKKYKGIESKEVEKIVATDYFLDASRSPRYFQQIASIELLKPLQKSKIEFFWLWQQEQAKLIPLFKLFIGFGKVAQKNVSYF